MTRRRQHLLVWGAAELDAVELVATVIDGPGPREPAVVAARRVLEHFGGLAAAAKARPAELAAVEQMGPVRAARLAAAFALAKRATVEGEGMPRRVAGPADVDFLLRPRIASLAHETFWVIALTIRNRVLQVAQIGRGGLAAVEVHPREVFHVLVSARAAAGIVVHNHPSGEASPSDEDLALTERLVIAGELMQLPILDHIVIATSGYHSILSSPRR